MRRHSHERHGDPWSDAPPWARELRNMLGYLIQQQEIEMATMTELQAAVARVTDAEDAVLALLAGIAQQLRDAQASGDPAAIAAVIATLDSNAARLAEAVVANTPAA